MKCIKKGTEIKKVTDEMADRMVANDGYNFCPRHEWRAVRDAEIARVKEEKKKKDKQLETEQANAVIEPIHASKKEARSARNKAK